VIVIASLLTAATVAAATATAAIAASASAQNQNATESARAAVCAMRVQLRHNRVVRVKTYAKVRTVRRGPVRNMRTLSAVPRTQTLYSNTATD